VKLICSEDTEKLPGANVSSTGPVGYPATVPRSVVYPDPPPAPATTEPRLITTPLSVILSSSALKIGTMAPIGIVVLPKVDLSVRKLERIFLGILGLN